jgi:cystathionine beta-synthase/cysteine synthase A
MIAAIRGYQAILTMPDKVSQEKQKLLREYGAEVIICPTDVAPDHPDHYVRKAQSIMAEMDNAFRINQYDNLLNREAHYATTGPEIWDQMDGRIDWFVAAGSTGGTVSGVGQYLKEQDPSVRVFMPDPVGSIYYPYFMHGEYDEEDIGQYSVEGVGEDHMAGCMDFDIIDDMCQFTDKQAFSWMKKCARAEGILPGTSCGGNLHGVSELIKRLGDGQGPDTDHPIRIVTVLPDTGLKYVSKF